MVLLFHGHRLLFHVTITICSKESYKHTMQYLVAFMRLKIKCQLRHGMYKISRCSAALQGLQKSRRHIRKDNSHFEPLTLKFCLKSLNFLLFQIASSSLWRAQSQKMVQVRQVAQSRQWQTSSAPDSALGHLVAFIFIQHQMTLVYQGMTSPLMANSCIIMAYLSSKC